MKYTKARAKLKVYPKLLFRCLVYTPYCQINEYL